MISTLRKTYWLKVGEIRLYVADVGAGRPILFLHGLGWDHHLWDAAFERYGAQYRVLAGDTRGHGRSDRPPGPYSIAQFAQDWRAVLDQLELERVAIVGFSQGGMVAMELACQIPERISALVLACTTCCTPAAVADNMQQRLEAMDRVGSLEAAKIASQSVFSANFIAQNPGYVQRFIEQRAAADQTALKHAMQAVIGFDRCAQLADLTMPCTVIAGEQDTLTPPDGVAKIHQALPQSEFVCIPNTGHMIPVEQPERFYAEVDRLLGRSP